MSDTPAAQYTELRPVHTDVGDNVAISKAIRWLSNCHEAHKSCPRLIDPLLPTRVVDVGTTHNSSILLHSSTADEHAAYVALSYCWGGPQSLVATRTNLSEISKSICAEHIPKTIADAILITRCLGFRYLWVDSLCILQDSHEDKAHEIHVMGSIYKNATVTIAAASAAKASDGFLEKREPAQTLLRLPLLAADGSLSRILVTKPIYAYAPKDPLQTRAWAFQESVLSPRVLVFGERELTWSCQTEPRTQVAPTSLEYFERARTLPAAVYNTEHSKRKMTKRQQAVLWRTILQDYSRRFLTNQKIGSRLLLGSLLNLVWYGRSRIWLGC